MELDGKGREELQKALMAAYPSDILLAQFTDYKFDLTLAAIAGAGPLNDVVYRLITWARAEGRLEELILKALEDKPHNRELQEFAARYSPSPAVRVNESLNALVRLVRLPEVQEALAGYRTDLRRASRQIAEMKSYKELHNLLHDLLVFCYNPIMLSIRQLQRELDKSRDPEGPGAQQALRAHPAWDDVEVHLLQLDKVIDDFRRDIRPKNCFDRHQITLIDEALGRARARLAAAFLLRDLKQLYEAAFEMEHVIGTQQPPVNTRLSVMAEVLDLPELISALSAVSTRIRELRVEAEAARRFVSGFEALADLSSRLEKLIGEHNLWQLLDQHLRQVDPELKLDIDRLRGLWPIVRKETKRICRGSRETWARNLRRYRGRLAAALRSKPPDITEPALSIYLSRIEAAYTLYRSQTVDRFYRVDKDLNLLCEELTKIGNAPLDAVSRVLERGQA